MSNTESKAVISEKNEIKKFKRKKLSEKVDEKALETIVFGNDSNVLENISKKFKTTEDIEDTFGFIEDKNPVQDLSKFSDNEDSDESNSSKHKDYVKSDFFPQLKPQINYSSDEKTRNKSVWNDVDDNIVVNNALDVNILPKRVAEEDSYRSYLENRFTDLYKTPKWAQIDHKIKNKTKESDDSDEDSDEDMSRTAQHLKRKLNYLKKGNLPLKKCTDLTHDNKIKTFLNCVEFHPTSTVALVSSPNGTVRLFQVDGKINAKIQTIKFKDFRIEIAKFNKSGEELIVGSKNESGFYYYYDMIGGKVVKIPFVRGKDRFCLEKFVLSNDQKYMASKGDNGFVNVLTAKTKEHIFDLKMNGEVMSMAFSEDSNYLLSHGNGGKAYVWDIRKRQCINRFTDEGCVTGTAIALSPDSKYCCTGSEMGVVNVYKFNDILTQTQPKPMKSLMNLTTEISQLKFNHSSELLVMLSNAKDNSIKCVHMNSLSVFSNFPFASKNYGRINHSDISLNSGYLTFATNGGTAHLFRITNFTDY